MEPPTAEYLPLPKDLELLDRASRGITPKMAARLRVLLDCMKRITAGRSYDIYALDTLVRLLDAAEQKP